jgi:hypothetical protein
MRIDGQYVWGTTAQQSGVKERLGAAGSGSAATAAAFAAELEAVHVPASDSTRYAPDGVQLLSWLTPDDRQMIAAATGLVISSDGEIQNPRPDQGAVDPFVAVLASERMNGRLEGDATKPYLQTLFDQYGPGTGNSAFDQSYLEKLFDYIDERSQRRAEAITPPSSFSVRI